jgi:DNA-binding transcriptional LysR family regulator
MKNTYLPFSLEQLLILRTIFISKSFKFAAQILGIAQPIITVQMQNLEEQLNTPVFNILKKQIVLTETGLLILRYSIRILSVYYDTTRALDEVNAFQRGKLTIAATQTPGTYFVPKLLGLFKKKYPNIEIQLNVLSTRQILWNLVRRQVDIGIIGSEIPSQLNKMVDIIPYAVDEFALILHPSHPFANLPFIKKEDLYRLNFISFNQKSPIISVIRIMLAKNYVDFRRLTIAMELSSVESIKIAVQSGLGAAFVSVSAIRKELKFGVLICIKIANFKMTRNLSLVLDTTYCNSKAYQIFKHEILLLMFGII